jgi:hypothetical protein
MGPPKVMKNVFSNFSLRKHRLPFVISTEAKRSG